MKKLFALALLLPALALAQTQSVSKYISNRRLTDGFVVPSGKTITFESGSTLEVLSGTTVTGLNTGDASTNTTTSVDGEFALFFNTDGKTIRRATGTGLATATSGVFGVATTSASIAGFLSDETGSNLLVFNTSPTLVTPVLGVATATSINKVAITAPATAATLTVADGKTFVASNSLTFTGTDSTSFNFPGASDTVATLAAAQSFSNKSHVGPVIDQGLFTEAAAPSTPASGRVSIYAKADGLLYSKDDAGTETLVSGGAGGGGMTNPMTTSQDIIVGGSGGTPGRLGVGSNGQVLKVSGGSVIWDTDSTGSGSLPATPTTGDLVYYDGADWVSLGIGSNGEVVKVVSGLPDWATDSTGGGGGSKTVARFFPRDAEFPTTNYANRTERNARPILQFDTTTQQTAYFADVIPEALDLTGGLTFYVRWAAETATSGTIGWDVSVERITAGGLDIDSDSFSTAQTITAATVSGTSGITSVTSVTISQANLPASLAAGDMYRVRLRRDVANDNATGDAEVLSLEIQTP